MVLVAIDSETFTLCRNNYHYGLHTYRFSNTHLIVSEIDFKKGDRYEMNEQQTNIMVINVDPLAFTVPMQIDATRFMVNVFHKDNTDEMYGILIINTNPSLDFVFFRNDKYNEVDEKITGCDEHDERIHRQDIKNQWRGGQAFKVLMNFGTEMELHMGLDIQKNGPDGKPELDEEW